MLKHYEDALHRAWAAPDLHDVFASSPNSQRQNSANPAHQHLTAYRLPRLLRSTAFRDALAPGKFIAGITQQQHMLIRHIQHGGILFSGNTEAQRSFLRPFLATLLLTHSPEQLRVAYLGAQTDAIQEFLPMPHTLGYAVRDLSGLLRLMTGVQKEMQRRKAHLHASRQNTMIDHNAALHAQGSPPLPHVMVVLQHNEQWDAEPQRWQPIMRQMMKSGAALGLHGLCLTDYPQPPEWLHSTAALHFIARASVPATLPAADEAQWGAMLLLENEHSTWLQPISVTDDELQQLRDYWERAQHERASAQKRLTQAQQRFQKLPPTPEKPSPQTLTLAVEALKNASQSLDQVRMTAAVQEEIRQGSMSIQMETIRRSQALASYLGWLGRGPLVDVLGISVEEADTIIAILRARQILERADTPTPRYKKPG